MQNIKKEEADRAKDGADTGCVLQMRRAEPADLPAVYEIERASFTDAWSLQDFAQVLTYDYALLLAAFIDDRPVGYCCLYILLDEGEIINIAVAPDCRRKKIAQRMLARLLAEGAAAGVNRFLLNVRISNQPALQLYARAGFRKIAVQKHFYEQPAEDAWLMELWKEG